MEHEEAETKEEWMDKVTLSGYNKALVNQVVHVMLTEDVPMSFKMLQKLQKMLQNVWDFYRIRMISEEEMKKQVKNIRLYIYAVLKTIYYLMKRSPVEESFLIKNETLP
jgi:ferredoxin-fold anticodon binding domain-containing protein